MTSLVRFVHHSTIAIVPPSALTDTWVWERCQGTRYKLRDRGYYRWPPHCNLIYPFIDPDSLCESIPALVEAAAKIQPFRITLSTLGTFCGYNRGVLWLDPVVADEGLQSSIYDLQSSLTTALRSVHGYDIPISDRFRPHMTLCHYPTLSAAQAVADDLAVEWSTSPVHFDVREVYVMERRGDGGQFRITHRLPLRGVDDSTLFTLCGDDNDGNDGNDGTYRFPFMPVEEEAWVREVRGEYKDGRRSARGRVNPVRNQGEGRTAGRTVGEQRRKPTTDTPEQMAEKRAVRAAKKAAGLLSLKTAATDTSAAASDDSKVRSQHGQHCPTHHTTYTIKALCHFMI